MKTPEPMEARRSTRRRLPLAEVVLVVASLLVSFLVTEVVLRLHFKWKGAKVLEDLVNSDVPAAGSTVKLGQMVVPSKVPRLVYQLRPNLDVRFLGVPVRTNSTGWRDEEFPLEPVADEVRILVLGDSVVFGWGVRERQRFMEVLEQQLAAAHPSRRWRTLAFAVPGYNLAMEVEALQQFGLATDPDLIVYGYVANDHCLPNFVTPRTKLLSLRSFLWMYATGDASGGGGPKGWVSRKDVLQPTVDPAAQEVWGGFCSEERVAEAYRDLVGLGAFWHAAAELAETARSAGVPVLFLNLSRSPRVLDGRPLPGDFLYLDVLAPRAAWVEAHGGGDYMASALVHGTDDPHPTAVGHRLIADELSRYLVEEGLIARLLGPDG